MRKLTYSTLAAVLILSGCGANFQERHHFATLDTKTKEVINIFRVTVKGDVQMANARYLAGYYDERAVDLFFNEVKATDLTDARLSARGGVPPIFTSIDCTGKSEAECQVLYNNRLRTIPIGSNTSPTGAFVMILSTDADAIAGTIGAFAENETVVGSAMYLATRSQRDDAATVAARAGVVGNTRTAAIAELSTLFGQAATAADEKSRDRLYLSILQAAAAGLAPEAAPTFQTYKEAQAWFAARPRSVAP